MSAIVALFCDDCEPLSRATLRTAAETLIERGPDGLGLRVEGPVGLAHLALHATAEDVGEPQPVLDDDAGLVLVWDGRLDNRAELLRTLARGEAPPGDAGLALRAYRRWGARGVERLLGDFAFALWDRRRATLLCARDALGVKPLYYATGGGWRLAVATEADPLVGLSAVSPALDEVSAGAFLLGMGDMGARTLRRDVRLLLPGHLLIANREGVQEHRWWRPDLDRRIRLPRDEDYAERYREIFTASVRDRLRTHRKRVGIYLSGGLDSGGVAAVHAGLRRQQPELPELAPYTYRFERFTSCGEDEYADPLALALGLRLRPIPVEEVSLAPGARSFRPTSSSAFSTYEAIDRHGLSGMAEEGCRVALTGHVEEQGRLGNRRVVNFLRLCSGQAGVLLEIRASGRLRGESPLRALVNHLLKPMLPSRTVRGLQRLRGHEDHPLVPPWLDADFLLEHGLSQRFLPVRGFDLLRRRNDPERLLDRSSVGSLAPAILWYDRAGARAGLDVRHPYLDRRLVEFMLAIPPEQIFHPTWDRFLVRRALAGVLPDVVRRRRAKNRFDPLTQAILREQERDRIDGWFREPRLETLGMVDVDALRTAWSEFVSGRLDRVTSHMLYYAASLESWMREYESEPPTGSANIGPLDSLDR